MNLLLLLAVLCLGTALATPKFDQTFSAEWHQWKSTHRRLYGTNEEEWRRAIWEKNMRMIQLHNGEYSNGQHGFSMEMNAFGDMTKEEAERMLQDDEDTVHLPFERGSLLQIPVKTLKYSIDPSVVNISDEMAKTAQWKALSMNTENAKVTRPNTSPEKPVSVTINFEDEPSKKYMDAETSL